MVARQRGSIAAVLSAALVVLSYTAIATEEQNDSSASPGNQSPPDIDLLIPLDDARRKTDPLTLAAELAESLAKEEGSDDDEESETAHGRELGNGETRKQRKWAKQQQLQSDQPAQPSQCSGSRPGKCGCARVMLSDYRGQQSTTESGLNCRAWNQAHNFPGQGLEDGAVCRNPDGVASRAWCFTDHKDVVWDYCDVQTCDDDMLPYQGTSTTGHNVNVPGCVDMTLYYQIEADIKAIIDSMADERDRAHFIGGTLRLSAHDFMDYDWAAEDQMGMDGCLDWTSLSNLGLSSIWNEHSALYHLHTNKYPQVSRPDFWLASSNAIIHITSVDNALDLSVTFWWGREERADCPGAASRLPSTESCQEVEGVFLERMGMKWKDAVALLGAHTVGLAHSEFSGHHGTWVPSFAHAQVFDKRYYQELVARAWIPHTASHDPTLQDWTTGNQDTDRPKIMLNTDLCLFYDLDATSDCCTRTDLFKTNGDSRCESDDFAQCATMGSDHPRLEASIAVRRMLGGSTPNNNNDDFYHAFKIAWLKATMNGMQDLHPLMDTC